MEHNIHTEQDLQQLIGQYESIRLDFKASALLEQPTERIVKQLTEDVSAFANTEGGVIVVGLREGKSGKKSTAIEIDEGVNPAQMSPERLEQLIASNISPAIPGLTVRSISLSGEKAGRAAYVVTVPRGATAYQARHSLLYYGRTEFAASPLHDNVIRLLMTRGKVPQAALELHNCRVLTADQEWAGRQAEQQEIAAKREAGDVAIYGRGWPTLSELEAPKRDFDLYEFQFSVANTGEMTLCDFLLSLVFASDFTIYEAKSRGDFQIGSAILCGKELRCRFAKGITKSTSLGQREYSPPTEKLFPGDRVPFPSRTWLIQVPAGASVERGSVRLCWTIYLDDARPTKGEIDMTDNLLNATAASPAHSKLSPAR